MGWKQQRAYAHSGSERKRPSVNVIESALASTCTKNHSRKLRQDAGIVMQPLLAVGRLLHDSVQGIPQAAAESQPTNKPARKTNVRGLRGEGGGGDMLTRLSTSPGSSNCTRASFSEKNCDNVSRLPSNARSLQDRPTERMRPRA